MRELKVIGIEPDGSAIVCADVNTGAKFKIPADDRLRAASHGDVSRLGQVEIEMEAKLRPREIQARIRAGASVMDIVTASGIHKSRVETFAHPVLLERARFATMAQRAYPLREDGPAQHPLATVVAIAFGARGQSLDDAKWDAWRNEEGRWVVQLRWMTGRTENKAHWRFNPGADGGTAAPLDDAAKDLVSTETPRPRAALSPVTPLVAPKAQIKVSAEEAVDVSAKPSSAAPESTEAPAVNEEKPADRRIDKRAQKPAMPSWEDVLLGVRAGG
ncbi:DUF3071 domain-containing protein [Hoyosella rhizosphaerae]|uniref:DUF3071 domain-containing protein n=1 Tax=Hoyosella rhizosphaerae TaxID=1755582 RepID=A0A916XHS8_9ACTN|nr:septation protein SepH [Hoyosella rhizosphaerae]MBN4928186.1 DUF3071 domain-containing protein [Hoyosella rhizosphaerae]GGC73073.1 hypothetical protein GCM10011410_27710 [Hoyosella rhizosphaerae]